MGPVPTDSAKRSSDRSPCFRQPVLRLAIAFAYTLNLVVSFRHLHTLEFGCLVQAFYIGFRAILQIGVFILFS